MENAEKPEIRSGAPALTAFAGLEPFVENLRALDQEIAPFGDSPDRAVSQKAKKLRKSLREFEPAITFIGQVKAGKTTLVNSLIGWPDLLPADVNPWTSVVTSVHLAPRKRSAMLRSSFRFFSNEEWDNLIRQGGRVGEIAARAGAADELGKVQAQLEEMRAKSKRRLGSRFQMLLGQTHTYDTLDADLIKRYVCMGDDFWEEAGGGQENGRFADITKTADLWFPGPDLPLGLCIQDTPGVNDTFMIREQITLNALRGSRLCVMVLSAQQALSSVDLGLIRLISNVKSRDVIIFVNRIDELSDPARDVPEIRASIAETLKKFDGPKGAEVIFGSAFWAEHAVANTLDDLGADSADALMLWATEHLNADLVNGDPRDIIWTLSGLPALGKALAERIEAGAGSQLIEKTHSALENLKSGASVFAQVHSLIASDAFDFDMSSSEVAACFDRLKEQAVQALELRLDAALEAFERRAKNSHRSFLDRATGELVKHLENNGEDAVWTYDPAGLRMLLRSAYTVFARTANKVAAEQMNGTADQMSDFFQEKLCFEGAAPRIAPPPVPSASAPVGLAQTIALDLKGTWWTKFWRKRRGYEAFAQEFAKLIYEETADMPEQLRADCVDAYADALRKTLIEFIEDQRDLALGVASANSADPQLTRPVSIALAATGGHA